MKKLWHQNRIFIILMGVVLACFIFMGVLLVRMFFNGDTSKYGDRLDNVENITIEDEEISKIQNELVKDELIKKAIINTSGKTVYIELDFEGVSNLSEGQGKAVTAMELFSEEVRKNYDFQFMLIQKANENREEIKIMGSKNVSGSGLVWNNNTVVESEE